MNLFDIGINGLLSEDESGQLTNNALLNAGLAIMAASGPQQGINRPSLGQALMQGLQSGSQAYQSGQKSILANREAQRKLKEEQQARELMASTAQGLGGSDKYTAYIEAGNKALTGGNMELAQKYFDIAKNFQVKAEDSPFAKIDPKDYTPESLREFMVTKDQSALVPKEKVEGMTNDRDAVAYANFGGKRFNQLTPAEAQQVNRMVESSKASAAPKLSVNMSDPTAILKYGTDVAEKANKYFEKDYKMADQYKNMVSALNSPQKGIADTTLLYSFFKVLDPESTVREGEIAMINANRSIPDKFKVMATKLQKGGSLTQGERNEILNQASNNIKSRKNRTDKVIQGYSKSVQSVGLDPTLYVPNPYEGVTEFKPKMQMTPQQAAMQELQNRKRKAVK